MSSSGLQLQFPAPDIPAPHVHTAHTECMLPRHPPDTDSHSNNRSPSSHAGMKEQHPHRDEPQRPATQERGLWRRIKENLRAPLAEFIGVAIFVVMGAGSDCQVVLSSSTKVSSSPKGSYLSTNLGWATGLALAVWTSAGVSGGHVNPAITLALATWRGFSWKKVPAYIFAQVMGGVAGASLVYGQYIHAIDLYEGGRNIRTAATASLFATFPLDYMTAVSSFFSEFLGTAILTFMIMAATDKHNAAPPLNMLPVVIFLTLLGLGVALGMQTAFSFNPARDFGSRLFLAMAGYGGILYSNKNQYWIWGGTLAPIAGAQVAVALYDTFFHNFTEMDGVQVHPVQRDIEMKERASEGKSSDVRQSETVVVV